MAVRFLNASPRTTYLILAGLARQLLPKGPAGREFVQNGSQTADQGVVGRSRFRKHFHFVVWVSGGQV